MAEQPNQRRWNDSVSDLPIFHGNDKDTITAESIVARVEAAANTLTWDDEQTYNNFSLAMRSNAEKWLTLQSDIRGADFRKSWAIHQAAVPGGLRVQNGRIQGVPHSQRLGTKTL